MVNLEKDSENYVINTSSGSHKVDKIISSLPAFETAWIADKIFDEQSLKILNDIEYIDMITLNMNLNGPCLNTGSFLTPSTKLKESKGILGVLAMNVYQ